MNTDLDTTPYQKNPLFITGGELLDIPEPKSKVLLEGGWISLLVYPNGNSYDIEISRIKNPIDLVKWLRHLVGKSWITSEIIEDFIDVVCAERGWKPFGC